MKILVALVLNVLLLGLALAWARRQYHTSPIRRLLAPLLVLKLLACLIACSLLSDDAEYFHRWSLALTSQLWEAPGAWLRTMLGDTFHHGQQHLIFHGFSNTFFIIKLLSALNLVTLGSLVLDGLYLSLFAFVGTWELVAVLHRLFPQVPSGASVVAFLVWPTVVYWSAGITKESLLMGSGAWLWALALPVLYQRDALRPATVVGAGLLAFLLFKMRFFFAVLLFGALAGLTVVRLVQHLGGARRVWGQVVLFAATLAGGIWISSELSPVFRPNKFTNQLIRNYSELREGSLSRPHIEYADLAPTSTSILANTPKAIVSTLVRPLPWEDSSAIYVAAGLENLLLLAVLVTACWALVRGHRPGLPAALLLALLFYCLVLAALLGLSTPNLGTLNRYRAVLLPYVLLLALQNEYAARILKRIGL